MSNKLYFLVVIFHLLFLSCSQPSKKLEYPNEISKLGLDSLFDNARWELYKYNLLVGEEYFNGTTDPRGDTILTDFEGLDIYFRDLAERGDTLSMSFSFNSTGKQIIKRDLETEVSFLNSVIIGLDLFNHIGILYSEPGPIMEAEFKEYLQNKEPSDLNSWLLREAKKRNIITDQ